MIPLGNLGFHKLLGNSFLCTAEVSFWYSIFLKEKRKGEIEACTFPQLTSIVFMNTVYLPMDSVEAVHFST